MCYEMMELRKWLDNNGIEWEDKSTPPNPVMPNYHIERTHFYVNGTHFSAIHGFGTYGGFNIITGKDSGLLELMYEHEDGEPKGFLTASDVINIVKDFLPKDKDVDMKKKLTKANIEELAFKIADYLDKELKDDAYCIYFNNKRINGYKTPRIIEEDCNPLDYFEYAATHHIISISSEGNLYEWYNNFFYEFPKELQKLFEQYRIYFEQGNSWNWTACPLDDDMEIEYTLYEKEPDPINVRRESGFDREDQFKAIACLWDVLTYANPDEGSCVIGAGIEFRYNGIKYFISSPPRYQCSVSWERHSDDIIDILRKLGCTGVYYNPGRLD